MLFIFQEHVLLKLDFMIAYYVVSDVAVSIRCIPTLWGGDHRPLGTSFFLSTKNNTESALKCS